MVHCMALQVGSFVRAEDVKCLTDALQGCSTEAAHSSIGTPSRCTRLALHGDGCMQGVTLAVEPLHILLQPPLKVEDLPPILSDCPIGAAGVHCCRVSL